MISAYYITFYRYVPDYILSFIAILLPISGPYSIKLNGENVKGCD
jgi:hypothetical protein